MDDVALLSVLHATADAVRSALDELADWGPAGTRPGQYRLDLAADEAAVQVLRAADLTVLSEESGVTGSGDGLWAVLDPVDGSTNAHLGIPMYATSVCVLDDEGPLVGLVANLATGERYEAVRGGGARADGRAVVPSGCRRIEEAVVGISGFPSRHLGWWQFRAFGVASLELCAVARGQLDAYALVGGAGLYPWDYMAGLLICREAGAVVEDLAGEDLVARQELVRRPVAAATNELLGEVLGAAAHAPGSADGG